MMNMMTVRIIMRVMMVVVVYFKKYTPHRKTHQNQLQYKVATSTVMIRKSYLKRNKTW